MAGEGNRPTGIEAIGEVPWGTHFCQFYKTKEDLLDLLVPYFKEGLAHNECCMWITSEPLRAEEAEAALRRAVPDLDRFLATGQLEILPYIDWYRAGGTFEADRVLNGWVEKLDHARAKGFEGLRLSGNTFWLESNEWQAFADYEQTVNRVIGRFRMMALCTYSLDKCGASEVIDVVSNHQFALIKREDQWTRIESAEQRRTEAALRESTSRYQILAESLPHLVWTCLPDGRCDYLSRQWVEYTGVPEERQLGYGWAEQVHPDDRQQVQDVWAGAVRDGSLFDVEFRIRRADGQYRWFKTRAVPLRDPSGSIVKWFGSNTDIDEQKRAEEGMRKLAEELEGKVRDRTAALSDANAALMAEIADRLRLEERQARLATILEATSDFVGIADPQGRVSYINLAGRRLVGLAKDADVSGMTIPDFYPERAWTLIESEGLPAAAQKGFWVGETALLTRDKREIPVSQVILAHKSADGAIEFLSTIARDITERKQAEAMIKASRDFYLNLFDDFPTLVWRAGLDAKCNWFNKTWLAFTGRTLAQELGDGWVEGVHPDDRDRCIHDYRQAFETRKAFVLEYRLRRHDGAYRWITDVGQPFNDPDGNFAGYVGSGYDFTDRKQAEENLSQSREMFRLVVNDIPQYVFWKDPNLNYLGCNNLFARAAGVGTPDAIVGKTDFDLAWKDTAERYRADDRSVMESKVPKLGFEEPQTRPDGRMLWLRTSKVPLIGRTGQVLGVLGIYEDITARKEMEAQAGRLERLAAMGQLLGGLAHELRNPLFILTGHLQLFREKLLQQEYTSLPADLMKIESAAGRMGRIIERFLSLARSHEPRHESCVVQEVLTQTLEFLSNELTKSQIRVETAVAPDLPAIQADPKQLQEVFLNLIMNAMQAMVRAHGKGTLTVSARLSAVGLQPSAPAERWIEVRIQDDGPGIPPEHRARLFEPFFSTRPPEQGTGLGLWTVRTIVMALRGAVTCESDVSQGATFIVRLPVAGKSDQPSAVSQEDRAHS